MQLHGREWRHFSHGWQECTSQQQLPCRKVMHSAACCRTLAPTAAPMQNQLPTTHCQLINRRMLGRISNCRAHISSSSSKAINQLVKSDSCRSSSADNTDNTCERTSASLRHASHTLGFHLKNETAIELKSCTHSQRTKPYQKAVVTDCLSVTKHHATPIDARVSRRIT